MDKEDYITYLILVKHTHETIINHWIKLNLWVYGDMWDFFFWYEEHVKEHPEARNCLKSLMNCWYAAEEYYYEMYREMYCGER